MIANATIEEYGIRSHPHVIVVEVKRKSLSMWTIGISIFFALSSSYDDKAKILVPNATFCNF